MHILTFKHFSVEYMPRNEAVCMTIESKQKIWGIYNSLPYDLSGSRTKDRFKYEVLFGIEQLIDNYDQKEDFCVVFDYVCDIEVHWTDKLQFYQVKTSNTGKNNNISYLTKKFIIQNQSSVKCIKYLKKH